ncbi:hypothetical protein C8J56DRAFT_1060025 [Mycena floridula]|nr:hypothetical protein C8J56DRAFT_1060025 [Mycena floridula]
MSANNFSFGSPALSTWQGTPQPNPQYSSQAPGAFDFSHTPERTPLPPPQNHLHGSPSPNASNFDHPDFNQNGVALPPPPPPRVLIQPQDINKMAEDLGLTEPQRRALHAFAQTAARDMTITAIDLQLRLFSQATLYQLSTEVHAQCEAFIVCQEAIAGLKGHMDLRFDLSKEQLTNLRDTAMDMIYSSSRIETGKLHGDVEKAVKAAAAKFGLENVFTTPARTKVYNGHLKKIVSSVKSGWRKDLLSGVPVRIPATGRVTKYIPLTEFVYNMDRKYSQKGMQTNEANQVSLVHKALLRQIVFDHHVVLSATTIKSSDENDEDNSSASPNEDAVDSAVTGSKRKRMGGRIPAGECFWDKVDVEMQKLVKKYGEKQANGKTKMSGAEYTDSVLKFDRDGFHESSWDVSGFRQMTSAPAPSFLEIALGDGTTH